MAHQGDMTVGNKTRVRDIRHHFDQDAQVTVVDVDAQTFRCKNVVRRRLGCAAVVVHVVIHVDFLA